MTSMHGYDVIIVGASVAGCTAATLFGRQGLTVALIERAPDPAAYKKVCTHLIQPSANATLDRLGVTESLVSKGAVRSRIEAWSPFGWVPWGDADEPGYNVRRQTLDPMLRELAARTPGVTLLLGHNATRVIIEDDRVVGLLVRGDGGPERELRGRLVVAADGRHGKLGELAGVAATTAPHGRFCYFAYYEDLELESGEASMAWFGDRDVAYCFRTDGGLSLVSVMPEKAKLAQFRANPEASIVEFFDSLPNAPSLASARRASNIMGMLEMENHVRPAAARGMAFVGDAALASDPVFGVGCGWALQSGEWLADIVGPALAAGSDLDAALAAYRDTHAARLHEHHALICGSSVPRPYNFLERSLFKASARDEAVASAVQRVISRFAQPKEGLTLGTLMRVLWVNFTKKPMRAEGPRLHPRGGADTRSLPAPASAGAPLVTALK